MAYYIFGYCSLVSTDGINGRGLKKTYKNKDLYPAQLCYFKRAWNTVWENKLFLGIEANSSTHINGVIFEIAKRDIKPLCKSEKVGKCYAFKNVSSNIMTSLELDKRDRVFAFVTVKPSQNGIIPLHYLSMIREALKSRGEEFIEEFIRTTDPHPGFTFETFEKES